MKAAQRTNPGVCWHSVSSEDSHISAVLEASRCRSLEVFIARGDVLCITAPF